MNVNIRPTNMASALINAAMSSSSSLRQVVRHDRPSVSVVSERPLSQIIIDRALSDDPKTPLKSGFNRAEHNGIRVSNLVLRKTGLAS